MSKVTITIHKLYLENFKYVNCSPNINACIIFNSTCYLSMTTSIFCIYGLVHVKLARFVSFFSFFLLFFLQMNKKRCSFYLIKIFIFSNYLWRYSKIYTVTKWNKDILLKKELLTWWHTIYCYISKVLFFRNKYHASVKLTFNYKMFN